jgi:hypothetical protein
MEVEETAEVLVPAQKAPVAEVNPAPEAHFFGTVGALHDTHREPIEEVARLLELLARQLPEDRLKRIGGCPLVFGEHALALGREREPDRASILRGLGTIDQPPAD